MSNKFVLTQLPLKTVMDNRCEVSFALGADGDFKGDPAAQQELEKLISDALSFKQAQKFPALTGLTWMRESEHQFSISGEFESRRDAQKAADAFKSALTEVARPVRITLERSGVGK